MPLLRNYFFLTLVLLPILGWSAPNTELQNTSLNYRDDSPIANAKDFFATDHFIWFVDLTSGNPIDMNSNVTIAGLGLHRLERTDLDYTFVYGISFLDLSFLKLEINQRINLCGSECGYSFWEYGFQNYMIASNMLGTLVNINHMKATVSYGYEDLFRSKSWIHGKITAGYGMQGLILDLQLGSAF